MSFLDEDDGKTDIAVAKNALVAAALRDRPALINLLAKYGAEKFPELRLKDLQPFTRECEAIKKPEPEPKPSLNYYELWAIGDTLDDCKSCSGESFARDAEKLIERLDKRGFRVVRK